MGYSLNIRERVYSEFLLDWKKARKPKENKAKDSKELKAMSGLLISHGKGLKKVVIKAIGALVIKPIVEKSVLPKL